MSNSMSFEAITRAERLSRRIGQEYQKIKEIEEGERWYHTIATARVYGIYTNWYVMDVWNNQLNVERYDGRYDNLTL